MLRMSGALARMDDWATERHPMMASGIMNKRTFRVRIRRAPLHGAGPPRAIRRSMSQVLEAKLVTVKEPVLGEHRQNPFVGAAGVRLLGRTEGRHSDN